MANFRYKASLEQLDKNEVHRLASLDFIKNVTPLFSYCIFVRMVFTSKIILI